MKENIPSSLLTETKIADIIMILYNFKHIYYEQIMRVLIN